MLLRIGVADGPWSRGVRGRVFVVVRIVFDVDGGALKVGWVVVTGFYK